MTHNILKLTAIIEQVEPNVFVGRVKEISGILSQADTEEKAMQNLKAAARSILEYKRNEALALLAKQNTTHLIESDARLDFVVAKA